MRVVRSCVFVLRTYFVVYYYIILEAELIYPGSHRSCCRNNITSRSRNCGLYYVCMLLMYVRSGKVYDINIDHNYGS
jgi:hypothetical protein